MRTLAILFLCAAALFLGAAGAFAQGRGGADWTTAGGDAQRTSWIPTDPKISVARLSKPGFQLTWKLKWNDNPSTAATLDRYIGYRGFRTFAVFNSPTGEITAFDSDLARVEWKKTLHSNPEPCGGMTANLARITPTNFAVPPAVRAPGAGRASYAKGAVGTPDEGAVIIAEQAARAAAAAAAAANRPPPPPVNPAFNVYAAHVSYVFAISSDGMLHSLIISNGDEPNPPVPFVPANANAHDLIVVDNTAYAVTSGGCNGAPNAVWALDPATKAVVHWTPDSGDIAGSAFGPDGAVYVAATTGDIAALEPKTLKLRATYHGSGAFVTSPVVFDLNKHTAIAAATANSIHLVDAATASGAAFPAEASGAFASWQDAAGVRWLAAPSGRGIASWKVTGESAAPVVQAAWKSREMTAPSAPIVVNGVLFTVSNSTPPVIYALDSLTGAELWNSGKTITSPIRNGGLSAIGGQLYIGASDGTIYAFGFPIEH